MPRTVRTLIGAGAFALLLAGCSGAVSGSTLGPKVAQAIAAHDHISTPTVNCPDNLEGKVGSTTTCTMTLQGSSANYSVVVEASSVSGRTVNFTVTSATCTSGCTTGSGSAGASGATGATGTTGSGATGATGGGATGAGATGAGATGAGATGAGATGNTGTTTSST